MNEHMAIMRNPWMKYLIQGTKTIESRISQRNINPYRRVSEGDYIYFRLSGKKLVKYRSLVKKVFYVDTFKPFVRNYGLLNVLRKYQKLIGINEEYIKSKSKCNYLSLFWLDSIEKLENPFEFVKRDQRAWICNFRKELNKYV